MNILLKDKRVELRLAGLDILNSLVKECNETDIKIIETGKALALAISKPTEREQIFLKEILVASKLEAAMLDDVLVTSSASTSGLQYIVKYALIVVACLPMMIIFPFVQKHFVKGVMIGAVKG